MTFAISGVFCAAATPFDAALNPDHGAFVAHCRGLIEKGCHGIALLGTTGEANSLSMDERRALLEAALAGGLRPDQLVPGVGLSAADDTAALCRHALSVGIERVVMLPPFYYKGVSDDGLFAAYQRVIERVNDPRLRIVLYNIPGTSAVALSRPLVARLIGAFPETIVGIKDSSGDYANQEALIAAHPGFAVLTGADPFMLGLMKRGGAGCITSTSNLLAAEMRIIWDHGQNPARSAEVALAQARIEAVRALSNTFQHLTTVKALLALETGYAGWTRVRPPLVALDDAQRAVLAERRAAL
jgi:4-hydroxy-tetrahydrodipicolinate synthase